jgi:hypothetical protein
MVTEQLKKMRNILVITSLLIIVLTCFIEDKKGMFFGVYIVFFALYMLLFFSPSTKRLSLTIKKDYPILYEKYKGRFYFFSDLKSVEFYRFTKEEMNSISDRNFNNDILQSIRLFKSSIIIFGSGILILIIVYLLKK